MNTHVSLINQLRAHKVSVSALQNTLYQAKIVSIEDQSQMISLSNVKYLKCFGFADIEQLGIEPTEKNKAISAAYSEIIVLLTEITAHIKFVNNLIVKLKSDKSFKQEPVYLIPLSLYLVAYCTITHLFVKLTNFELMFKSDCNKILAQWKKASLKLKKLVLANKSKLQSCNLNQSEIQRLYSREDELLTNGFAMHTEYIIKQCHEKLELKAKIKEQQSN